MAPEHAVPVGEDEWRRESCSLAYVVRLSAIVEASISAEPPPMIEHKFAAPLRLDVHSVRWAGRGVTIADSTVGSAYFDPDGPRTLAGTFYEDIWPSLKPGQKGLVLLRPDPYQITEFAIAGLAVDGNTAVTVIPDVPACKYTQHFEDFARRVGRRPNLDTFIALVDAQYEYDRCLSETPGYERHPDGTCDGQELADAAMRASAEVPETEPNPDDIWRATPPDSRSLAFTVIPDDVVPHVGLVGVHVEFVGQAPDALYSFRCDLGVGYLWGRDGLDTMFPVPACRESPLLLVSEFNGDIHEIGSILPDQLDYVDGIWVTVDFSSTPPAMATRRLQPGEAEKITGMDSVTLEEIRERYSDPG